VSAAVPPPSQPPRPSHKDTPPEPSPHPDAYESRVPGPPLGLILLLSALFCLLVVAVLLSRLPFGSVAPKPASPDVEDPAPVLAFAPVPFDQLPGFDRDRLTEALPALAASCRVLLIRQAGQPLAGRFGASIGGVAGDWHPACQALLDLDPDGATDAAIRAVIIRYFQPYSVSLGDVQEGLFTGYFEPVLRGSLTRSDRYRVPLYAKPADLVSVDLGQFRPDLKGRRIAGRVDGGRLAPFDDRAAISAGALAGQGLELVYVDDPVDAFILHIQGSGKIDLDDGRRVRVAYAGQNGHVYVAIGRVLRDMGALQPGGISMPTIRQWLTDNPDAASDVMNSNRSFIFFTLEPDSGAGPKGSAGVPLTAGRSLAVDRTKIPLHIPVFLDALRPNLDLDDAGAPLPDIPFQALLVAQDTGGAIRGEIRGDVFWGEGRRARDIAGRMAHPGRYYVLLPQTIKMPRTVVPDQPASTASEAE